MIGSGESPRLGPSRGGPDALGRPLRDIRISVTDRCNFRCVYCMPKEVFGRDHAFLARDEILSFEEITRLVRIAAGHGVTKVRLTGGEPLLRKGIVDLVRMISDVPTSTGGALDVALTTNGSALTRFAVALKDAGLSRVTVSLDSPDDVTFQAMNDVRFPVAEVLRGIEAAHEAGLGPIKVNMVVKRGMNDRDILPMARLFRGTPHIVRFIEFMDVGATNGWRLDDVVPSDEVLRVIDAAHPLVALESSSPGETANRWAYADGAGEIGVISSVTQPFCRTCSRARVSVDGKLYTCLFGTRGHDLRALMRDGCTDDELSSALADLWRDRSDRYSETRTRTTAGRGDQGPDRVEMSYIGG